MGYTHQEHKGMAFKTTAFSSHCSAMETDSLIRMKMDI